MIMNKLSFYKYAAGFLLVLNILVASFFLMKGKPHHNNGGGKMTPIHESMNFSEGQLTEFLALVDEHKGIMKTYNQEQIQTLEPYFTHLYEASSSVKEDSIMTEVLALERKKIESVANHFEDVKAILNEEQYPGFEIFVHGAVERILGQKPNIDHPKKSDK